MKNNFSNKKELPPSKREELLGIELLTEEQNFKLIKSEVIITALVKNHYVKI